MGDRQTLPVQTYKTAKVTRRLCPMSRPAPIGRDQAGTGEAGRPNADQVRDHRNLVQVLSFLNACG